MSRIPATDEESDREESDHAGPGRSERSSDPFVDSSIGANAWAKVAPRGSQYWLVVVALAIVLTVFSAYWRATWLPNEPLGWETKTEFAMQQAIGLRRPILVWCEGDPLGSFQDAASQDFAEQDNAAAELAAAIKSLDVEPVRVRIRMKSAFLAKVDSNMDPAIHRLLGWEPSRDLSGLLLWHPQVGSPKLLTPSEISPEQIITWLNAGGK